MTTDAAAMLALADAATHQPDPSFAALCDALGCERNLETALDAVEGLRRGAGAKPVTRHTMQPIALAIFTETGNIRIWSKNRNVIEAFASQNGMVLTPLYDNPSQPGWNEAIEAAANIADGWITEWGDFAPQYSSPQRYACDAVTDIAEVIRALTRPVASSEKPATWRDIIFDGWTGPEGPRFIEIEDENRRSVGDFGKWMQRNDEHVVLRVASSAEKGDE